MNRHLERSIWFVAQPGRHWASLSLTLFLFSCYLPGDYRSFGIHFGYWTEWDLFVDEYKTPIVLRADELYVIALIACFMGSIRISLLMATASVALTCGFAILHLTLPHLIRSLTPGCMLWIASAQILFCNQAWQYWQEFQRATTVSKTMTVSVSNKCDRTRGRTRHPQIVYEVWRWLVPPIEHRRSDSSPSEPSGESSS